MPLGQTVCGTEGCFVPLAANIGRKMGKTPTIFHQHTRELVHVTVAHLGRDRHFSAVPFLCAPSVTPLAEAEPPPGTSPAQEKLNFAVPTQLLLNGGRGDVGQPSFPYLELLGQWARTETGRAAQGSLPTHLPHLSGGRCRPISRGAGGAGGRPALTLCPAQLQAPFQEASAVRATVQAPCRSSLRFAAEHACDCWEMGGRVGRTASSLRRVISCHRLPVPELWLRPGGSKLRR